MKSKMTMFAFVTALVGVSTNAQASEWKTGSWSASPQSIGHCQMEDGGSAKRLEIRDVACMASDGNRLRDQDCEGKGKPDATRWLSCKMKWSCADWHEGVFAEGAKDKVVSYKPARSSRIGASIACANAKEADPAHTHSCRASLADGMLERLSSKPTGLSSNQNYAWISCSKSPS